ATIPSGISGLSARLTLSQGRNGVPLFGACVINVLDPPAPTDRRRPSIDRELSALYVRFVGSSAHRLQHFTANAWSVRHSFHMCHAFGHDFCELNVACNGISWNTLR